MHLLILGGSGNTGKLIIEEALARHYTATALVRNPDSIAPTTGLTIIQGTPLSTQDLERAFEAKKVDAVIVALASLRTSGSPFSKPTSSPTLMYDAHVALVTVAAKFDVKRIVTMQALGVGSSKANVFFLMRAVINHSNMNVGFKDHEAVFDLMRGQENVEWTGPRPVMLADGEKKDVKTWGDDGKGSGVMPSITRMSVAAFLVGCVEESGKKWIGKMPVISN
jgi:putative NADH-flavin reductase